MNKRIILVEDDPGIRDTLQLILEQAQYTIDLYKNGDILLNSKFQTPSLFILDKQLPGVDGVDLCRHLKSQPAFKSVPVLILSASPAVANSAMKAGADGFLEKPFSKRDLLSLVAEVIKR